jgi:replicative DNA helicase
VKIFDIDSENTAISALIFDDNCRNYGLINLTCDDFSDMENRISFDCVVKESEINPNCTPISLYEKIYNKIDKSKLEFYRNNYSDRLTGLRDFKELCKILNEKSLLRKYRKIGLTIQDLTDENKNDKSAAEISKMIESDLMEIITKKSNNDCVSYLDAFDETLKMMDEIKKGNRPWITTGISDLDKEIIGYNLGDLVVISGRPSMGKSIFCLLTAENIALSGQVVDLYSLEERRHAIVQRGISNYTGIDHEEIKRVSFSKDKGDLLVNKREQIYSKMKLWINDFGRIEDDTLISRIRYNVMRHKSKVVIIDHLGYIFTDNKEGLIYSIGVITKKLKTLAKELNIVMILVSQLNRGNEKNQTDEDKIPTLTSLRYSGEIEQDADIVIALYRKDYYNKNKSGYIPDNILNVLVLKGRNSDTANIQMHYDYSKMQIRSLQTHQQQMDGF